MSKSYTKAILYAGCLALVSSWAIAGSVSSSTSIITRPPPLVLSMPVVIWADCQWPAGQEIMQLATVGGDGNPVTYTITGGDMTDFKIPVGTNSLQVGPNGIATASCNISNPITITATQQ